MTYNINSLPKKVGTGGYISNCHVQGIACDGKYMYYSFTTSLLKTDLDGNCIGSVSGILGHLGCITYAGSAVYGSLEYKHDVIGKGILKKSGTDTDIEDAFYIARFDVDKIDRMGMDAEKDGVLTAVRLAEVCEDYKQGFCGCSGIDGITFCDYPDGMPSLFVAYGIYSDVARHDNDDQIILKLALERVNASLSPLSQGSASRSAIRSDNKYFVRTGNTCFGVQNLEYDSFSSRMLMAVYRGKKPQFPNYNMYMIDLNVSPDGDRLSLANAGLLHKESGIRGFEFPYGATGMISLGSGYFYFSQDGKNDNGYYTNIVMYRFDGEKFTEAV